ncbi:probable protein phosphatase 2c 12 [Phtheirospermum japonicum]|uniref:protein-serine/threonine phosphatase n=1 Tax=Phtheirospermum japonicum TaxID=374723 RepID=A0A830BK04_9LAMI|nr:probable protein phosphatase 2c 12 [Phtheirospermum japonicum]
MHRNRFSCSVGTKRRRDLRLLRTAIGVMDRFSLSLIVVVSKLFLTPHSAEIGYCFVNFETVPLSVLLKRESANEKIESPEILHGQASQSKKGEDFTFVKTECQRVLGDGVTTYSVFALFDGHNGSAAAIYAKENLLNNVLSAIPSDLNSDEWVSALPRALVAGFVKTDKDFQERGWVLTVASVGDSRGVLESAERTIYYLSADHRLDCSEEERERITASGGEVGRLNTGAGTEIGPLRCWPGGLCLSRSIGDMDVGEFIVPVPYVKQVKLSSTGGRLIISSDGVWDALTAETAFECCREMSADAAASQIVKEAVQVKGLRDDTTCIVVDIQPAKKPDPPKPPPKKQVKRVFKSIFHKKCSSESSSHAEKEEYCEPNVVEELFEEGSALLSERSVGVVCETPNHLSSEYCQKPKRFFFGPSERAVEIQPGKGISIHDTRRSRPWDGPFLCSSCHEKKQAMEGKSLSRVEVHSQSARVKFKPRVLVRSQTEIKGVVKYVGEDVHNFRYAFLQ